MFDNPQQEVKNMSKKLRPIKLSDEAFELFYKEIYAEFGPKDVPPVDVNPKKEIQEEVAEEVIEVAQEPVPEEIPEEIPNVVFEEVQEEVPAEIVEETQEEAAEEDPDELNPFLDLDEEPETEMDAEEAEEVQAAPEVEYVDHSVQEEAAKAAAQIRDVQEDEVMDDYNDGEEMDAPKKKKGVKALVFAICLELLAIAGVVAYWLLYIL